jgi:WD40 repeat protein
LGSDLLGELLFSDVPASSFAFSPNGSTLAIGRSYVRNVTPVGNRAEVLLWNTRRRRTQATITIDGFIQSIAFSPKGNLLAVAVEDRVELWNVSRRTQIGVIRGAHGR